MSYKAKNYKLLVLSLILFLCGFRNCMPYYLTPATYDGSNVISSCNAVSMQPAMIKSQAMQEEINAYLKDIKAPDEIYIGLFYDAPSATFSWADNEILGSYTNWDAKEPDQLGSSFCTRMKATLWRTIGCKLKYQVLCMSVEGETTITKDLTTVTEVTPSAQRSVNENFTSMLLRTAPDFVTDQTILPSTSTTKPWNRTVVSCPNDATSLCQCRVETTGNSGRTDIPPEYLYKVDKTKKSAYIRKHTSAHDDRYSARVMGLTGLGILVSLVITIVCLDIQHLVPARSVKG